MSITVQEEHLSALEDIFRQIYFKNYTQEAYSKVLGLLIRINLDLTKYRMSFLAWKICQLFIYIGLIRGSTKINLSTQEIARLIHGDRTRRTKDIDRELRKLAEVKGVLEDTKDGYYRFPLLQPYLRLLEWPRIVYQKGGVRSGSKEEKKPAAKREVQQTETQADPFSQYTEAQFREAFGQGEAERSEKAG